MEQWLIPIISSVLGGLVGGLFTYFGVRLTLNHQDEQKRKENLRKQYDERPRLEITNFKNIKPFSSRAKFDCDFILTRYGDICLEGEHVLFSYNEKILDTKNLCCVEYKFTNTGKTEIEDVCFTSNQKELISLLPINETKFHIFHRLPECEAWTNKRPIKPGETLTLRVCYLSDEIISFYLSALVSIHLKDIYGVFWHQPLFCPKGETDNSSKESYGKFKEEKDIKPTLEYLKKMLVSKQKGE